VRCGRAAEADRLANVLGGGGCCFCCETAIFCQDRLGTGEGKLGLKKDISFHFQKLDSHCTSPAGAKNNFLRASFPITHDDLPRQARDKDKKTGLKDALPPLRKGGAVVSLPLVGDSRDSIHIGSPARVWGNDPLDHHARLGQSP
jgi:hypothetical protein